VITVGLAMEAWCAWRVVLWVGVQVSMTALAIVASTGDAGMVQFLLGLGAQPDPVAEGGVTPLQLAVTSGSVAVVRALVEGGADVQRRGKVRAGGRGALRGMKRAGGLPRVCVCVRVSVCVSRQPARDFFAWLAYWSVTACA
jgi:hypothetical protein